MEREWKDTTQNYIRLGNSGHYMPFFLAPPEVFDDHWVCVIMMYNNLNYNQLKHI